MRFIRKRIMSVLLAIVLLFLLTACGAVEPVDVSYDPPAIDHDRFIEQYYSSNIVIITDTRTDCQYLAYRTTQGTGLTQLIPDE